MNLQDHSVVTVHVEQHWYLIINCLSGSNGKEGVFHIPESSRAGASPSYGLMSYPRQSLKRESYPSAV